jgi:VWFA-related protein
VIFTRDNSRSQEFTEDRALLHKAVEQLHEGFTAPHRSAPAASVGEGQSRQAAGRHARLRRQAPGDVPPLLVERNSKSRERTRVRPETAQGDRLRERGRACVAATDGSLRTAQTEAILQAKRANVHGVLDRPFHEPYLVRNSLQQQSLAALSEETGGFVTGDRDDLARGVAQLLEETGSYYLLGYQSPRMEADGKLRSVAVKVDRPDVQVQARAGLLPAKRSSRSARGAPSLKWRAR